MLVFIVFSGVLDFRVYEREKEVFDKIHPLCGGLCFCLSFFWGGGGVFLKGPTSP